MHAHPPQSCVIPQPAPRGQQKQNNTKISSSIEFRETTKFSVQLENMANVGNLRPVADLLEQSVDHTKARSGKWVFGEIDVIKGC